MSRRPIVTFLSDYGLEDEFVGVCQAVMRAIASGLEIINLHHNILRQDIRHGAVVLRQSIRFIPPAVHLAVVDPTVGSDRRAVVAETDGGHTFVGPDNGLLVPVLDECGGATRVFEISNDEFMLTPVSRTFQGRDVFAPAAAHVASGLDPARLGPALPASDLVQLEIPNAWAHDDHLHAEVLQPDRFGNLQLNFGADLLADAGLQDVARFEVRVEGHR